MTGKHKKQLSKEFVLERLLYDNQTGTFVHKEKPITKPQDKSWNAVYAGTKAGWIRDKNFSYILVTLDSKRYYAHHLVWLLETGQWPSHNIDHKNGDPSDNRFANLRECTQAQNCMNNGLAKNNSSGHKGVSYYKAYDKFQVRIEKNAKVHHIGYFKDLDEAIKARDDAEHRLYGDFHHRKYRTK